MCGEFVPSEVQWKQQISDGRQLPNSALCGELLYSDSLEDLLWR
jgi:hypothetical protein